MQTEDVAYIDGIVNEFRARLLKVGDLKRTSKAQRQALSAAYSLILSLPALVRERAAAWQEAETDRICAESEALARSERT